MRIGFSNSALRFFGCTTPVGLLYSIFMMRTEVFPVNWAQLGCGFVVRWGMNIAGSLASFRLFLAKNVSLRAVVAITMAKRMRGRTTRFQRPACGTFRKKGFVMRVESVSHNAIVREMVPESK